MNKFKNTLIVRLSICIGLALPAYFFLMLIQNRSISDITLYGYVQYSAFVFMSLVLMMEGHHALSSFLEERIQWNKNFRKRLLIELLATILSTPIITTAGYYTLYHFVWDSPIWIPSAILYFGLGLLISTIFMGFVNAGLLIDYWKEEILRTEKLEKESIRANLNSLQSQLSPHFIFNNFNNLDELIDVDPNQARTYLHKLAEIFRYVIDLQNQQVVDLEKEFTFLNDYYHLIKLRFNEQLNLAFPDLNGHATRKIPPASLQLVIENVIKHNEISTRSPIKVDMYFEHDFLIISNNKRPKLTSVVKTGLGLENLRLRYQYLSNIEPIIEEDDSSFTVKLPLLNVEEI